MKRTLALLLTLVLAFSFIGCSSSDDNKNDSTPSVTEAPVTTETPADTATPEPTAEPTEEPTPTPVPAPEVYIKDVFAAHGVKAGSCVTKAMLDNKRQSQILLDNFNSLTLENAMKPDSILSQNQSKAAGDVVVYFNSEVTKVLSWAKENGFSMRGHTLVWYSQTPEWLFHEGFDSAGDLVDRDTLLARMESMIKQTFELIEELGYSDLFYAYDVVNEAWMENGTMRDCRWKQIIGDDYLWYAFYFADKYAPENINLYYNDYNEQFKTETLYKFAETLKDEDGRFLIDGIGFQAHLYTTDDLNAYFNTVDRISSLGLKVQLTELDVCLGKYQAPAMANDENLKKQGRFYYDLINGLLERVDAGTLDMDALTFWGFADGSSWRKEYNPLLFNRTLDPKYSFYGATQVKDWAGFND